MAAGKYNIEIEQGAEWQLDMTWRDENDLPIDLTNFAARMHIRESYDDRRAAVEITTENGGIVLGGVNGTISLRVTTAQTERLDFVSGVYDLELVNQTDQVTRLLEGKVRVSPNATK